MIRLFLGFSVALVLASGFSPIAVGQMAGLRGGVEREGLEGTDLAALDPKVAEGYITIEGRAEVRVRPTDVRMVLAVTSEAETAQKCQQSIDATIDSLKKAWTKLGIGPERIVVDFIAVLPRYQWTMEKQLGVDVEVEKKVGYRMQTNVHLAAKGEAEARAALRLALEQDITDIIAFDYWSKDLDDVKAKVRLQALKAARGKADVAGRGYFRRAAAADQRPGAYDGPLSRIAVPFLYQRRRPGRQRIFRVQPPRSPLHRRPIVRATRTTGACTATATCSPASCR